MTHYQGSISPSVLSFGVLIKLLAMIVIGGWGTFWGPIFGTAFLILLEEKWLREGELQEYRKLVLGLMLATIAVLAPRGLLPVIAAGVRRLVKGPPSDDEWDEEELKRAAAVTGTEQDDEREKRGAPIG
jgi:branched-chain amino acid transport system permease protein